MSSFFKKTACVTGIILLGLFGLIGFYSTTLPDFYLVSKGSELSVNSFFTISSKPCESKVTVAVSGGSSGASRYTKNMLMLFGAVPVKEVESKRGSNDLTFKLCPRLESGSYKAGMWVRDSSAGIGTLTFYDPENGTFGGLGHPVCDADTKEPLPLSAGTVGEINLTGFNKSRSGCPGQLLGEFANSASTGDILKNCESGVFGTLNANPCPNAKEFPLGFRQEIHPGKAKILSSIDNDGPKEYEISIEQINLSDSAEHDLVIKVTDKTLLEKTGGILQGMSGSPIIQDGRLVGAVTHVFIEDTAKGYGIFADEMYSKTSELAESTIENAG